jgi:hypothetical protein
MREREHKQHKENPTSKSYRCGFFSEVPGKMGGGVWAWVAFRLGSNDRWRRQRRQRSVRAWAVSGAFGSGLGSVGGVRIGRWQRLDLGGGSSVKRTSIG